MPVKGFFLEMVKFEVYMIKKIFIFLVVLWSSAHVLAFDRNEITVLEVGLSKNTGRVFVKGSPAATETSCTDTAHYSMPLGEPESYLFYSAALTAMNQGKKMRVQYEDNKCVGNGPQVDVYWNLNK